MRTRDRNLAFLFGSALLVGLWGCSNSDTPAGTGAGGSSTSQTASGSAGNGGGSSSSSSSSSSGGASSGGEKSSSAGSSSSGSSSSAGGSSSGGDKSSGGSTSTSKTTGTGGTRPDTGTGTSSTGGKAGGTTSATGTGTGGKTGGTTATGSGGTAASTGSGGTTASTGSGGSSASTGSAGSTGTIGGEPVKSDGCGKTSALKTGTGLKITLKSPGTGERAYNLKLPDNYDNTHPYRLIMAYHWVGGTANDVSTGTVAKPYYGMVELAKNSAILVAPDGTPNTMMGSGGNMWANSNGADVEFSRQLIEMLEGEFCIDKSRVFCEGFSMGGSMSYAMACGLGDVVRAVAIHSGGTMSGCAKHDKPVAFFMTHGTNDSVCKWPSFPIPLIQDFAKLNGCTDPDPKLAQDALVSALPKPTDSNGKCIDFKGCKPEYPTRVCLFVGDHTPSPSGNWVPTESWKFLSQF